MQAEAAAILRHSRVTVHPDHFTVISISKILWPIMLADNALGPRGDAPFMIFSDETEVTLILNKTDFENLRDSIEDSRYESGFRLLTFSVELDFSVVGFIAEFSRILAEAGVAIFPLASFSRDHCLIYQKDLGTALTALGPYVEELC